MATTVNSVILPTTATTSIPAGLLNPNPTSIIRTFPPVSSDSRGSRSVSYFLGFLIALLAFLVFFVGCVIAARRGLLRRRRRDDEVGDRLLTTMTFSRVASHVTKPVLWEATFEKGSSRWESIMPLCVAVVPEGVDGAPGVPPYIPMPMPVRNWLRPRERMPQNTILPSWMPRLPRIARRRLRETIPLNTTSRSTSRRPPPLSSVPLSDESGAPMKRSAGDALTPLPMRPDFQVVVMVAMPSQHAAIDGSLGNLEFGITKLPAMWDSSVGHIS